MTLFFDTVNAIAPVFVVVFLGVFLNHIRFFSEVTKEDIVKLVYYVGTPALLFHTVAKADLSTALNPKLLLFVILAILGYVFLLIGLCFKIRDPKKKGAVIQIGFRSNFAIAGMPLAISLMDNQGVLTMAIVLAFVTICYNVTAVILLSYYGNQLQKKSNLFLDVIKNPLIIGTALGLVVSVLKLPIHPILDKSLEFAGDIASSLGLLIIGANITLKGFQTNRGYILLAVFFRNILAPALFLGTAILLGFRGNALIITSILSATPAAVNCFVMAKKLGVDPDISAYGVSLTSLVSIGSIFICVYLVKLLGLA
ncbi:MAG: AEC family transporter [Ruminococcaceae bacterium]|nr:AEC family transporter [Oscillospiraceae bacterium]